MTDKIQALGAALAAATGTGATPAPSEREAPPNDELMGGVGASLNGWPGNQGTRINDAVEYRGNSGAHDGGERPATIKPTL